MGYAIRHTRKQPFAKKRGVPKFPRNAVRGGGRGYLVVATSREGKKISGASGSNKRTGAEQGGKRGGNPRGNSGTSGTANAASGIRKKE